jgi:hypothetical protein
MDDVAVVYLVDAPAVVVRASVAMGHDMGAAEPGLDPVVVDMDAQAMADQAAGAL